MTVSERRSKMIKNKIDFIKNHFEENPDACYIAWRGTYPIDDSFCRLNMVFAYVLFKHEDNVMARKIAGTSYRKENTKKIIFSTELLRAFNPRTKRKRVVTLNDLHTDEESYPAGLLKTVEAGSLPYHLNENREGDIALVDVLHDMVNEEDMLVTDHIIKPLVYLCAYEQEVYRPKTSAALVNQLKMSPRYDEDKSLDFNFNNCFDQCFVKLSEGRWLVNYDWVIGKGIPYIDLNSLYNVYKYRGNIKQLDYEDSTFIFKVSDSLKW